MTFKEEQDVIKMIGQVLFVQDLGKFLIATNSEYQSHTFRKLYLSNELVLSFFRIMIGYWLQLLIFSLLLLFL